MLSLFALTASGAYAADDKAAAPKADGKQDEHKCGPRGHHGFGGKMGEEFFKKIDTNNDGAISKEENATFAQARFNEQDANKDGKLTKEEIKAFHKSKFEQFKKEHPDFKGGRHHGSDKDTGVKDGAKEDGDTKTETPADTQD